MAPLSSPLGGSVHSSPYLGVPSSPGALFPFLHPLSSGEHRANMSASLVRVMRCGGAAAVGTLAMVAPGSTDLD